MAGGVLLAVRGASMQPMPAGGARHEEPSGAHSTGPGRSADAPSWPAPGSAGEVLGAAFTVLTRGITQGRLDSAPVATATARWVARWSSDPQRRHLALRLGGDVLVDWLVRSACRGPSELQAEAERALVQLMGSGDTVAIVLSRPRVAPRLLAHIARGNASDDLVATLESFVWGQHQQQQQQQQQRQAAGAHGPGLESWPSRAEMDVRSWYPSDLRRQDIKEVVRMLNAQPSDLQLQRLIAGLLAWWADSSGANRKRLAGLGLQAAVAAAARDVTGGARGPEQLALQTEFLRVIAALSSGGVPPNQLAPCIEPCLLIAADAAAEGDEKMAASAAATLATCMEGAGAGPASTEGRELAEAVKGSTAEALMVRLWTGSSPLVQTQVARVVGCMARCGALQRESVVPWVDRLLDSFCTGSAAGGTAGDSGEKGKVGGKAGQGAERGKVGGGMLATVSSAAGYGASAVASGARVVVGGTVAVGSSIGSALWYAVTLGGNVGDGSTTTATSTSTSANTSTSSGGGSNSGGGNSGSREGGSSAEVFVPASTPPPPAASSSTDYAPSPPSSRSPLAFPDPALQAACVDALTSLANHSPGPLGLRVTYHWLYRLLTRLTDAAEQQQQPLATSAPITSAAKSEASSPAASKPSHLVEGPGVALSKALGHVSIAHARSVAADLESASSWAVSPPPLPLEPATEPPQQPGSTPRQGTHPFAAAAAAAEAASEAAALAEEVKAAAVAAGLQEGNADDASAAGPSSPLKKAKGWWWSSSSGPSTSSPKTSPAPSPAPANRTAPSASPSRARGASPLEDEDEYLLPHVDLSDPLGIAPDIVGRQVVVAQARLAARLRRLGASLAEKGAADAMEVINSIIAQDPSKQAWLHAAGILRLLQRLTAAAPSAPLASVPALREQGAGAANGDLQPLGASREPDGCVGGAAASLAAEAIPAEAGAPGFTELSGMPGADGAVDVVGAEAALAAEVAGVAAEASVPVDSDRDGTPNLGLKRHTACLLAMLALVPSAAADVSSPEGVWSPWLHAMAKSEDCRLASHATKALLHLRVAGAGMPAADVAPAAEAGAEGQVAAGGSGGWVGPVFGDMIHLLVPSAQHHWALAEHAWREGTQQRAGSRAPEVRGGAGTGGLEEWDIGPGAAQAAMASGVEPEVLQSGIPTASSGPSEPVIDVVFVHGIRGGPFITWRKKGVVEPPPLPGADAAAAATAAATAAAGGSRSQPGATLGSGAAKASPGSSNGGGAGASPAGKANPRVSVRSSRTFHLPLSSCWPTAWLAEDFPEARLLTVEYAAPFTNYEFESLPLEATAARVTSQLLAAGVGQRPVVFVCHSMGGLLVKEVLARAVAEAHSDERGAGGKHGQLVEQTKGVLFYATPHFGSNLAAMGWKLHHVGAKPAPSLARLTPGPHLYELNAILRSLHERGVCVTSLLEGQATEFGMLPRMFIVPPESGYPGFGERMVLDDQDHVQLCKPASKESPGYVAVKEMLEAILVRQVADDKGLARRELPPLDLGAA